jgi:5-(carboxyamino)imidazole ribonucleotide mutase
MSEQPLVGVVMGSKSDYEVLSAAVEILRALEIPHEARVVSAHRTPDLLFEYAETARARGLRVIIAGAGGAAHLPGMLAAKTLVPVLGVPVAATQLNGLDALLSIVQMPKGVPVGTLAIGKAGAANAALLAAEMLATTDARFMNGWRRGARRARRKCWSKLRSGVARESFSEPPPLKKLDCAARRLMAFWAAGNWDA